MYLSQSNYPQGLSVCILGGILGTVLHQLQHKMTTLKNSSGINKEIVCDAHMETIHLCITVKSKEMSIKIWVK